MEKDEERRGILYSCDNQRECWAFVALVVATLPRPDTPSLDSA